MLSTKDLKYQMVGRRTEKLMERFVGPYKVQKIVSLNTVKLELPSTVKIHLVVNISRIQHYVVQVEGQKKKQLASVIIEGEEEQEVKRILNKQKIRGKDKYLVRCYAAREFSAEMQHGIYIIPLDFTIGIHSRDLLQALDIIQTQDWVLLLGSDQATICQNSIYLRRQD